MIFSWCLSFLLFSANTYSDAPTSSCSATTTPPPLPEGLNLNLELRKLEQISALIDFAYPETSAAVKVLFMVDNFGPGKQYDFKSHGDYSLAKENAGNWFYGAGASAMGYSDSEVRAAAGVVQQYTDYKTDPNIDFQDFVQNTIEALANPPHFNDNPSDVPLVGGGLDYYDGPFDSDDDQTDNPDSCYESEDVESIGDDQSGINNGGRGVGGGWLSIGSFIGASRCIGNCEIPPGKVTVTDL